jgi:crossover junction endodeoxyribonuclease RuvC
MPTLTKTLNSKEFIILGIDPGYEKLGIAVLQKKDGKETLLHSECFITKRESAYALRLCAIGKRVEAIIENYKPNVLAIENLFVSNNQKTAMKVGEVRGVILYLAAVSSLAIYEYTPLQVKMALTGYGKSEKSQVAEMVKRILKIKKGKVHDDEMDAIAIALTGSASIR